MKFLDGTESLIFTEIFATKLQLKVLPDHEALKIFLSCLALKIFVNFVTSLLPDIELLYFVYSLIFKSSSTNVESVF